MQSLPSPSDCCTPCQSPVTTSIPGPPGIPGAPGSAGIDGVDAFTKLSGITSEAVPAIGSNIVLPVQNSAWMAVGQVLFVQAAGYYKVITKPDVSHVEARNLGYDGNAAPGVPFVNLAAMSPAGIKGADGSLTGAAGGSLTGSYPNPGIAAGAVGSAEINASIKDAVAATASLRTLGTGAQQACAGDDARLSNARTPTGSAGGDLTGGYPVPVLVSTAITPGTYGSATMVPAITFDAKGRAIAATGVAFAGLLRSGLLGYLATANLNQAVGPYDLAISLVSSRQIIRRVMLENASVNLTTAQVGVYTGTGATGAIIAGVQSISALNGSGKWIDLTLASGATDDVVVTNTVYLRVATAQGAVATVNVWIFGEKLD